MGCLEEQMPPDCVEFVYNTHVNLETTNKLLFGGLPFHKLWKTRTWKRMVNAQGMMLSYAGKLVAERIDAIETSSAALEAGDAHAELGEDFLTYMIHSGKMSVQELSVNAIDLLLAGVDTVRTLWYSGTGPSIIQTGWYFRCALIMLLPLKMRYFTYPDYHFSRQTSKFVGPRCLDNTV